MLRFAKEVARGAGVPVAIIPASRSGSALGTAPPIPPQAVRWVREPDRPMSRDTLYGSAVSRVLDQGYAHPIRGVIWYQGENNLGQTADVYRSALAELVANLRADLGNPALFFASCQLSWFWRTDPAGQTLWLAIQEGQRQYAASDPLSALVATVDVPADGIHLAGRGYREVGRRLGLATLRGAYGVRADVAPRLRRLRVSRGGQRVSLSFDRRVAGGHPGLFGIADGTAVPSTAFDVRGRRVRLELIRPVGPSARITYGLGAMPQLAPLIGARGEGGVLLFEGLLVGSTFR